VHRSKGGRQAQSISSKKIACSENRSAIGDLQCGDDSQCLFDGSYAAAPKDATQPGQMCPLVQGPVRIENRARTPRKGREPVQLKVTFDNGPIGVLGTLETPSNVPKRRGPDAPVFVFVCIRVVIEAFASQCRVHCSQGGVSSLVSNASQIMTRV
jgi:hypothetical protein